jgi:hypothetical protein
MRARLSCMKRRLGHPLACFGALLAASFAIACAGHPRVDKTFEFFTPARADDPFYTKIADWQRRQRVDLAAGAASAPVPAGDDDVEANPFGLLRAKFDHFLSRHKRALAQELTTWSQRQARLHYTPDPETTLAGDDWPTVAEFFDRNGDDCDGLDLIAYALLREAGFRADETYRLVVRRERDGANHMVTLWFEDPEDPWVIDATGAMTREMRKFSDLPPGWLPRMMFNENETYNVSERGLRRYDLARDDEGETEVHR